MIMTLRCLGLVIAYIDVEDTALQAVGPYFSLLLRPPSLRPLPSRLDPV
ncbi:hypothetical protein MSAN_01685400 [Mycena sanguinolenta]|uniref:Uncharacterized protein n=1 Tax=Mycena sanguinolenta TaxID=230812 RepID=A0A8H7CTB3_9AGAR|nr:hypothetical protein MSAN_01685400 [Mycena sanguinolenta]